MCGISTICELFDLTPRAVRFYEDRGLVTSGRDRFNCRRYDAQARARLGEIAVYRQAGLSIDDILEIFALAPQGPEAQREFAVEKLKARLAELDAARGAVEQLLHKFADDKVVPIGSASPRLAVGGRG